MIQNHNQGNLKTYEYIHELKLAWIRRISNNSELIAVFLSFVFVFVLFCFCFVLFYFYAKHAIYTVCCTLKGQNFENNLRNKIILQVCCSSNPNQFWKDVSLAWSKTEYHVPNNFFDRFDKHSLVYNDNIN